MSKYDAEIAVRLASHPLWIKLLVPILCITLLATIGWMLQ